MPKIVRLQQLQAQLHAVLEAQPELARAFEQALVEQDEQALAAAFDVLRAAPNDQRLAVEAAILEWLFGGEAGVPADPFAGYPEVSTEVH